MFDEIENPHTKTISMTMRDVDGNSVTSQQTYDFDTSWPQISYQFFCFLSGMGYRLNLEDVNAEAGEE